MDDELLEGLKVIASGPTVRTTELPRKPRNNLDKNELRCSPRTTIKYIRTTVLYDLAIEHAEFRLRPIIRYM